MPTYEYQCGACGGLFDYFHGMSEPKKTVCETCGGPLTRLLSAGTGLIFKGSGFYITDYTPRKEAAGAAGGGEGGGASDKGADKPGDKPAGDGAAAASPAKAGDGAGASKPGPAPSAPAASAAPSPAASSPAPAPAKG